MVRKGVSTVHMPLMTDQQFHESANGCMACIRLKGCTLAIINLYLPPCSTGVLDLLNWASTWFERLGCPTVILGDYNHTPEQIINMGYSPAMRGSILTPQCPWTCRAGKGSIIDYGIGSYNFKALVKSILPVYDIPVKPHIGVAYQVNRRPRDVMINTLVKPRTLVTNQDLDDPKRLKPIPFAQAMCMVDDPNYYTVRTVSPQVEQYALSAGDARMAEELGQKYSQVSLAQEIHRMSSWTHDTSIIHKYHGRGQAPIFKAVPLVPKKKPEYLTFDDNLGFMFLAMNLLTILHKYAIREEGQNFHRVRSQLPDHYSRQDRHIEAIHHVLHCMQRPPSSPEIVPDETIDRLLHKCRYIQRLNTRALRKTIDQLDADICHVKTKVRKQQSEGFAAFIHESLNKPGAGAAHRYTAGKAKAPPLPEVVYHKGAPTRDRDEHIEHYQEMWDGQWQRLAEGYEDTLLAVAAICRDADEDYDPITIEDVKKGARLIPRNTTIGIDHWETAELRALDEDSAQAIADLLNEVEKHMVWPKQSLSNLIVLMGKNNGGVRPIALMPMLYRLWSKIRRPQVREWEDKTAGPWDAAVRGSSALRAGVLGAFFDELHSLDGDKIAAMLWDMDKFYDSIDIAKLTRCARELGYPMMHLGLGLKMHMASRVLKVEDGYQFCKIPANGIIAGCLQSTYFAKALVHKVVDKYYHTPMCSIRQFVDDIAQRHHGPKQHVIRDCVDVGASMAADLVSLGCRISPKSTLVGSD